METTSVEKPLFRLLVLGDGSVRTIPLRGTKWTVGRAPDCDVPLLDPTVSRRHLQIERVGDTFQFQDLGGSNPVLLDGRPLKHGRVAIGQTLAIGMTRLVIERRSPSSNLATSARPTVVLSREVAEPDYVPSRAAPSLAATAARVLDRLEWTFADLGDLTHAAEPLLELALSLTERTVGWIGRITQQGQPEAMASLDTSGLGRVPQMAASLLVDAQRIGQPHLLTTQEGETAHDLLLIPLGTGAEGLLVLEHATEKAPAGQEVLRLASSLGKAVWNRLQETTERLRMRDELRRLQFHGTAVHHALLASSRLQDARLALRALAGGAEPVLLLGEDGTEIEELARYCHAESPRRAALFVPWNAERVPEERHELELFGDGKGNAGEIQRAAGGTLFVHHLERVSAPRQQRLAAAARMPAASGAPGPALIAATALPLARVSELSPLPWLPHQCIEVPPLRGNARDVQALAELILSEIGNGPDGSPRLLTERAKRLLVGYAWPGNVRELRLVLEDAATRAGAEPIAPRHLPPAIASEPAGAFEVPTLEEIERQHILDVMQRTAGNRSRTAQLLGIATSTLYEKLKRYRVDP
jgi:transcriptional regulator with AAA-type ATPase domain/pSer/pThr/pTyr-binding forkhead associated (FHA) protein